MKIIGGDYQHKHNIEDIGILDIGLFFKLDVPPDFCEEITSTMSKNMEKLFGFQAKQ